VTYSNAFSSPGGETGATLYNKSTKAVDIVLPGANVALSAHELHHAFQFDKGEMTLAVHNGDLKMRGVTNWLTYDQTNETSAYRIQGLFGSTESKLPASYTQRIVNGVPFPPGPTDNGTLYLSSSSHARLQTVADQAGWAFRVNNTVYAPK
jgi:hypothetical protein